MLPSGNGFQSALKAIRDRPRRLIFHEGILCRADVTAPRALIVDNLTSGAFRMTATLANVLTTWPILFS